ncbi:MAG: hypothetical protein AAF721_21830, partial [Myxococcota bacterium]
VGGAIPAACTGGAALPWMVGAFDACLGYYELSDLGEFLALARECGLSRDVPRDDQGPITGHEAGCTWDDCDPTTECVGIIKNKTFSYCVEAVGEGTLTCEEVPCGDRWDPACESGLEQCIENTTLLWLEDKLEEEYGDEEPPADALAACHFDVDPNHDGSTNGADVRALAQLAAAAPPLADLDGDGAYTNADRDVLVHDILAIPYGDANEDGQFSSADMVLLFESGKYESGEEASWSEGDFDGDGQSTSQDLVVALADGCYEQGPDCI